MNWLLGDILQKEAGFSLFVAGGTTFWVFQLGTLILENKSIAQDILQNMNTTQDALSGIGIIQNIKSIFICFGVQAARATDYNTVLVQTCAVWYAYCLEDYCII